MPASSPDRLDALPLTHSATLRRLLYEALSDLGLDPGQVYLGINQHRRLRPPPADGRLHHDDAPQFWLAADALCGDPDIGLHLGEAMKPRLLDVVGYLLLASRDLEEALVSFLRFQHILSGGFVAQMRVEGDHARLVIDLNYLGYSSLRQQMECLALLFTKLLGSITDGEFRLLGVEFRHPRPARVSEHQRLFGLMPAFGCEHDVLVFPAALLKRPSRTANPDLHRLLWGHAETQLAALAGNDLLNRLRYLLEVRLGPGVLHPGGLRRRVGDVRRGAAARPRGAGRQPAPAAGVGPARPRHGAVAGGTDAQGSGAGLRLFRAVPVLPRFPALVRGHT